MEDTNIQVCELQRALRIVEKLIATSNPYADFAEDLVCLEMNRKGLAAALSIEHAKRHKNSPPEHYRVCTEVGRRL